VTDIEALIKEAEERRAAALLECDNAEFYKADTIYIALRLLRERRLAELPIDRPSYSSVAGGRA
jgi:hypothetical protein